MKFYVVATGDPLHLDRLPHSLPRVEVELVDLEAGLGSDQLAEIECTCEPHAEPPTSGRDRNCPHHGDRHA